MPPLPKPAAQRRRRNVVPGATKLPAAGLRTRAPALPGGSGMLASTRTWWKTAWASPMATVWLDADVPALVRLAQLVDLTTREFAIVREGPREIVRSEAARVDGSVEVRVVFDSPVTAALLAEMRQLEDRLGLSPLSRRRLQWEIDQAAGESAPAPATETQKDRWLRVAN
jgi:hypothetical protein